MKKLIFCLAIINLSLMSQWVEQNVIPHPPAINSVYAFSSDVGFAAADSGKILRTSNAGVNWTTNTVVLFIPNSVRSVQATTLDTVYCICNAPGNGRIFKSVNSGSTWTLNFNRSGGVFYDLKFINSNTGYVYGQPSAMLWFIAKTTNAGLTWDSTLTRPPADNPFDTGFPNALHLIFTGQINIWFGTSAQKIFYSPNGGLGWIGQPTIGSPNIYSINFLDQQNGFAGGTLPFRTNNGGTFWQQQPYQNTGPFYSFINSGGKIWYSSGLNIFYSTNGGINFILQHTSPGTAPYKHISITFTASDNQMSVLTGWGVTSDGIISRYDEFVGIKQIGTNIPENFKLEQNYPNPFNPVTQFRFEIPLSRGVDTEGGQGVSIKVYDILGNEITTLVNSQLKPGIYKTEWDASNYPSGIYFYKLTVQGFSETKKMILIK